LGLMTPIPVMTTRFIVALIYLSQPLYMSQKDKRNRQFP
jgi:hypothetical protein